MNEFNFTEEDKKKLIEFLNLIGKTATFNVKTDELINYFSSAIRFGFSLYDIKRELFFHPSISESVHSACETALNRCIDIPKQ